MVKVIKTVVIKRHIYAYSHYFDAKPAKVNKKRKPFEIAAHDAPAPNAGGS